jgi:hypothetical protein
LCPIVKCTRTNYGTPQVFQVNVKNELTNAVSLNGYYDASGNMTQRVYDSNGPKNYYYVYDDENRLVEMSTDTYYTPSGSRFKTTWTYDGPGRVRVRKEYYWYDFYGQWAQNDEVRYVYDGMRVIQERNLGTNSGAAATLLMKRPDQDRFDAFSRHLDVLDGELSTYCALGGFELEKNLLRQPGRVLRRRGNPEFLIDVALSGYWLEMDFSDDLPHTITAIGYYERPGSMYVYRMARVIVANEPFSYLTRNLRNHLDSARELIANWSPQVMREHGERVENLRRIFGTQDSDA